MVVYEFPCVTQSIQPSKQLTWPKNKFWATQCICVYIHIYIYMCICTLWCNTLGLYVNSLMSLLPQHKTNTPCLHWNESKLQAEHVLRRPFVNLSGEKRKSQNKEMFFFEFPCVHQNYQPSKQLTWPTYKLFSSHTHMYVCTYTHIHTRV